MMSEAEWMKLAQSILEGRADLGVLNDRLREPPFLDTSTKGIPTKFHSVVEKYGRDIFSLVFNAQVAGQAVAVVAAQAEHFRAPQLAHAALVISGAFNELSNQLCRVNGWTGEMLGEVERDIQLAWKERIVREGDTGIVLQ